MTQLELVTYDLQKHIYNTTYPQLDREDFIFHEPVSIIAGYA